MNALNIIDLIIVTCSEEFYYALLCLTENIRAKYCIYISATRPKPVGHGYVFSMAVGTIGGMVESGPPFFSGRTFDSRGGGGLAVSWPSNTL